MEDRIEKRDVQRSFCLRRPGKGGQRRRIAGLPENFPGKTAHHCFTLGLKDTIELRCELCIGLNDTG